MKFHVWPWKPRLEDEVEGELRFHLEMRTRELVDSGLSPDAARREAERRFGDIARVRAACRVEAEWRDTVLKRSAYLSEFWRDIWFTCRSLRCNPGFSIVAILTLAIGIGATTAIFSAVYAVVLKPLPLDDPSRLFLVTEDYMGMPGALSAGNYVDAVAGTTSFEGLAALQYVNVNLSDGVTPERVRGGRVTANFFEVLGSRPEIGRVFRPDEDRPGSDGVIVLSHRLWMSRFGASADVLGRVVRMNGAPFTVVGVMPASFDLTADSEDLWSPVAFTPERKAMHDEHYLQGYGRLRPGVSKTRAEAELGAVAARLRRENPRDCGNLSYVVVPFMTQFVGDYRSRLFVLLAAVGLVLLIACGNVANLLLARGAARAREVAVRAALGAGRSRIVRQFLAESLVLAGAAALVGLIIANVALPLLVAYGPVDVPRLDQARLDVVATLFTIALAVGSTLVFGLAPALRLSRTETRGGLREGTRGATSAIRDRLRTALIVAEVALSVLLLFGAGLLIRSAIALDHVDAGFDPHNVFTARFTLPEASYTSSERIIVTLTRIADEAGRLHGVSGAAVTQYAAMGPGGGSNGLLPEGRPFALENLIQSQLRVVTPGFFSVMRIPIVKGRRFDERDRRGSQKVMIISEALAARAYGADDPIGKRMGCCEQGPDGRQDYKIVVGVARDLRSTGPATPPAPEFYLPLAQAPDAAWSWFRTFYLTARIDGAGPIAGEARSIMSRIDPDLPLFDIRPMDQRLAASLATARFNTALLTALGVIGLILAATGIYGVIAYSVAQRSHEIGVRMALGATAGKVMRLVISQALPPVVLGMAGGLAAALVASRALTSQLFDVNRSDPATIVTVSVVLLVVASIASAIPARRATQVDPTQMLRY